MSELYEVTVEAVADRRVELRITAVHPHAGPPPLEPSFPLNLLIDLWDDLERGFASLVEGMPPMSDDQAVALARRAPWATVFRQLRDLSRGAELPITREDYDELVAAKSDTWKGQRIAGWGGSGDAYVVYLSSDEDAFRAHARTVVTAYTQDQLENQDAYSHWPDQDQPDYAQKLPRARLVVELAQAGLLGFASPGMRFETAAYF